MTLEDIEKGESRELEFKGFLPKESKKWVKTVVAFANGAGGKLVIGVNDERKVVGIPDDIDIFELKDKIADIIASSCDPIISANVYAEDIENKTVIVIQVYPGLATPYYIKSEGPVHGVYVRLSATSREADEIILDELHFRGRRIYYDELPRKDIPVKKGDVSALCRNLSERAERKITKTDLLNFKVLREADGELEATNAYAILVGKHDFTSRIQCARFKGVDRCVFIDKKDFEGPLCEQIDKAFQFVLDHINMGLEINGITHKEVYELPPAALRELIVNAAVHRNYQCPSSIQVAVYDDRVEITSPGMLYGSLTIDDAINGVTSTRNRVLARTLEKAGVVEGWGSGLKRIRALCEAEKVDFPEILELGNVLRFNFYRINSYNKEECLSHQNSLSHRNDAINLAKERSVKYKAKTQKTRGNNLSPREEFLLQCLRQDGFWTKESLAKELQCSKATIDRTIATLTQKKMIARKGANKKGSWEVLC